MRIISSAISLIKNHMQEKKAELSVEVIITIIIVLAVLFILLIYLGTQSEVMDKIWAKGPFG